MLINRDQRGWALFTLLATLFLTLLFLAKYYPSVLPIPIDLPLWLGPGPAAARKIGATPVGLAYGIVAFAIFIFAAALGFRKKVPLWRLGSAKFWLKAHIWLTVLTIPLVIMHADFRTGAPMTFWLLVLYAIVMLSGFYGLALQQVLPRLMKERLPLETVFEQILYLTKRMAELAVEMRENLVKEFTKLKEESEKAEKAAEEARLAQPSEPIKEPEPAENAAPPAAAAAAPVAKAPAAVAPAEPTAQLDPKVVESFQALIESLEKEVLPYLMVRNTKHLAMNRQNYSDQVFRVLKLATIPTHRESVDRLESWCDERRSMDLQKRYQHWLHSWLLVHVPMSFILIAYTGWHAIVALFNY